MHELAIAGHVVDIAARHADGRKVTKVYLKVGHLRQVVPSALTFSFDLVAQGTPVEGAEPGRRKPGVERIFTSAATGRGVDEWCSWLTGRRKG